MSSKSTGSYHSEKYACMPEEHRLKWEDGVGSNLRDWLPRFMQYFKMYFPKFADILKTGVAGELALAELETPPTAVDELDMELAGPVALKLAELGIERKFKRSMDWIETKPHTKYYLEHSTQKTFCTTVSGIIVPHKNLNSVRLG